jgi:hypothetical protein
MFNVSHVLPHRVAQAVQRQSDTGFDRAKRQSGLFRNLRMTEIAEISLLDQLSLLLR